MARVDGIDVYGTFYKPSVRGNMSMGFWMFFRKVSVRGNISTYIQTLLFLTSIDTISITTSDILKSDRAK